MIEILVTVIILVILGSVIVHGYRNSVIVTTEPSEEETERLVRYLGLYRNEDLSEFALMYRRRFAYASLWRGLLFSHERGNQRDLDDYWYAIRQEAGTDMLLLEDNYLRYRTACLSVDEALSIGKRLNLFYAYYAYHIKGNGEYVE